MIDLVVAYVLGALTYYLGHKLYDASRQADEILRRYESPVVTRIRPYLHSADTPAEDGQRDTPPHREGGRDIDPPAALRQPGEGSEGRDAATSGRLQRWPE